MIELNMVEDYLKTIGLEYERRMLNEKYGGEEIKVFEGKKIAFVVFYHAGSLGGSSGKLEITGKIKRSEEEFHTVGHLKAADVVERIKEYVS